MRESESKVFQSAAGPVKIVVQALNGKRGFTLSLKLAKTIFPALGKIVRASKTGDRASIIEALAAVVEKTSPEEFETLLSDLLKDHLIIFDEGNGKVHNDGFDKLGTVFMGRVSEIYKIFVFGLEVNYSDFFHMLKAQKPEPASEEAKAPSPSA